MAGLVAEGLNNNQVAARMYISTHTVAHHLRQAFRKLSIASRYELTRIVIEQAADGPAQLALLVAGVPGGSAPGHPAAPPAQRPVAETVVYLRGPGTMVCCRNYSGMLMVISQIRGVNCVDLGGLTALDIRQGH